MGVIVKDGGSKYPPIENGLYYGVCYGVIDLGTHFNPNFGKSRHEVAIFWELPQVRINVERDGRTENMPRAISRRYTMSLNEKANLRRDLESWRGKPFTPEELKGFDLVNLIGIGAQLQIIINEKGYNAISAIVQPPKDKFTAVPENKPQVFSFDDWDGGALPGELPEWVRNELQRADEYRLKHPAPQTQEAPATIPPAPVDSDAADDLPF